MTGYDLFVLLRYDNSDLCWLAFFILKIFLILTHEGHALIPVLLTPSLSFISRFYLTAQAFPFCSGGLHGAFSNSKILGIQKILELSKLRC